MWCFVEIFSKSSRDKEPIYSRVFRLNLFKQKWTGTIKKSELNLGIVNTHNWSLKESLCWLTERRNCILKPILYWRLGIKMNAKRKAGFKMIEQTAEDSKTESHRALTATTTTQPLFLFSLSVPDHCMVPKATGFPFYTHKPASRPSSPFLPLHPSIHQPFYPLWRKRQEE
jgi:hypothetical protein